MEHEDRYSLAEFARYSRLPRSTIRYFERVGILSCEYLDEPIYRYSAKDLFRLNSAITLKNLGYSSKEIAAYINARPLSLEHLEEYQSDLDLGILRMEAQKERLERYAELIRRKDDIWIQDIEPYLIKRDIQTWRASETLYHREEPLYLPISNGAAWFEGPSFYHPEHLFAGRAVPQRYASLISGYADDLDIIGGCLCICGVLSEEESILDIETVPWQSAFDRLVSYATEHNFIITNSGFIPYIFRDDKMYGLMCLPIEDHHC